MSAIGPLKRLKRTTVDPTPDKIGVFDVSGACLFLAQSGHENGPERCPLSRVRRTSGKTFAMSAFDPERTSICLVINVRFHGSETGFTGALGRPVVSGDELIGDVVEVVADNLGLRTDS
jgi:hypothetical protein